MIKEVRDSSEVLDFMWRLSEDKKKESYHLRNSKEELKKDLENAIASDMYKVLASYHDKNNNLQGAAIYFWTEENKYAQTTAFLIDDDYISTADEIINYIKEERAGYELLIPLTFSNIEANEYLRNHNFECIESSYDTRLYSWTSSDCSHNKNIKELDDKDFEQYAVFHDKYAMSLEMYLTSRIINQNRKSYGIYIYWQDSEIVGSIVVNHLNHRSEVFALFLNEGFKKQGMEIQLIRYMLDDIYKKDTSTTEVIYFIEEENKEELEAAFSLGFKTKATARTYRCKL